MKPNTVYRLTLWLPLLVPAVVAYAVHGLDLHPTGILRKLVQFLLMSLLYGGIPYAVLAVYAMWWIDDRPEPELRRGALMAPLWMVMAWLPVAALVGLAYYRMDIFLGLFALGAGLALTLGYAYVALAFTIRQLIGRSQ